MPKIRQRVGKTKNLSIMLAKFTLIGKHNVGKTTTLRVLIYLLYKNVDKNNYVHLQYSNVNNRGTVYSSSMIPSIATIFNSTDMRIRFNTFIPLANGEEKSIREAIATPGDIEEEIVKNWDFFSNNYIYRLKKNEANFIHPFFAISSCSQGRAITEEQLEQNWHIQNWEIDYNYWFKLPIEEKHSKLLEIKQWPEDINSLYSELEENGIFSNGRRKSTIAKLTRSYKMQSLKVALLIKEKIYELSNLL